MKSTKRDYTVAAVVRSFAILEALARSGREMGVLEVSKAVKIHVSTVYRLLNTLMNREFVDQNPETEKYRLGIRLFELGVVRLQQLDYRNIALPQLQALHNEFEETVFLGTLRGNEVLIIESFSQPRGIVFGSQIGAGEPIYCTGIGKALLANLAPEQRDDIVKGLKLERFTARTLTSRNDLRKELDSIRQRGYSIDDEEIVVGVKCVAAPILGSDGYAVAAFSIAGPADRMGRRFRKIATRVAEVSRAITRELRRRNQDSAPTDRSRSPGAEAGAVRRQTISTSRPEAADSFAARQSFRVRIPSSRGVRKLPWPRITAHKFRSCAR